MIEINTTGNNLLFTRLCQGDFMLYSKLIANGAVMKYITGRSLSESETQQRFQKALDTNSIYPEAGVFIAKFKRDGEFAGVAKLVPYGENQVEVGYMLLPEHWGKGLASEMVAHMILLCREKQLAEEIIGIVDPENHASVSVLAKFGFTQYKTGEIDGLAASWYKLMLSD